MSGWRLLLYSQLLGFVFSLISGSIVGALVGVAISIYVLVRGAAPLHGLMCAACSLREPRTA